MEKIFLMVGMGDGNRDMSFCTKMESACPVPLPSFYTIYIYKFLIPAFGEIFFLFFLFFRCSKRTKLTLTEKIEIVGMSAINSSSAHGSSADQHHAEQL